jgi:hypothetical protein
VSSCPQYSAKIFLPLRHANSLFLLSFFARLLISVRTLSALHLGLGGDMPPKYLTSVLRQWLTRGRPYKDNILYGDGFLGKRKVCEIQQYVKLLT